MAVCFRSTVLFNLLNEMNNNYLLNPYWCCYHKPSKLEKNTDNNTYHANSYTKECI